MCAAKNIYKGKSEIYAKYHVSGSDDILEGEAVIIIKNSGKQPVSANLKIDSSGVSFAPIPPEEHSIKAKDLMELFLKIDRWFRKFGYNLK
jgi:hypothetical protein